MSRDIQIAGLQKVSLIDYPGKICATVFLAGCNLRCPFCHNASLVLPERERAAISEDELFEFLTRRLGLLDGVCVTGGEPLSSPGALRLLGKIRGMGYAVKLDTNGTFPERLSAAIGGGLVDYIAMDIKTSLPSYEKATGVAIDAEALKTSVELIKHSGIDHEFRTTALKVFLQDQDMRLIASWMQGAQKYYVRRGNLKNKILDFNYFADTSDYTDEEWGFIKMLLPVLQEKSST